MFGYVIMLWWSDGWRPENRPFQKNPRKKQIMAKIKKISDGQQHD